MGDKNQPDRSDNYYFASPEESITIISELLENENFRILARYYDLSNSGVSLSDLESGDFFIRNNRPEVAHPGGFWRYKHPFPPGFKFRNVQSTPRDRIYRVEVAIDIDQGPDSPEQIGVSYFYMIKSDNRWKILPDQVSEDNIKSEMPHTVD